MDRLTNGQSLLLKRISAEQVQYSDLTTTEKEVCDFLKEMGYISYQTRTKSRSFSGVFQLYEERESVSISENGKMYLINEQLSEEQRRFLREQIDSMRNIAESSKAQADSAKTQAELAEAESKIAQRDAIFSKITSIIAILISIGAIVATVLTN